MSSAYAKYSARYLFVPRSSARINTGRGCSLLPVIFVSPRYAAVRCIAAGCAVYVLSAVLDIGGNNAIYRRRRGYVRMQNVQHIAAGVQYMYCQPCWILAVTMQYIAVGVAVDFCQLCSISVGRAVYLLLAVPDIAGDYAIYRYRQGYVRMQNVQHIAVGCAVYVLSAVLDIGSDNAIYRRRRGYVRMQNVQHIDAGVQYMYCQPCWILAVTIQ